MGMDVYGKNPTSKNGEYLRQSVWGWRPLWNYACDIGKLDETLRKHGHCNDGAGLETQEECDKLANILQEHIDSGHCKAYEERYLEEKTKADIWNNHIYALQSLLREYANKEAGKENVAPVDYNKHHRELWDKTQNLENNLPKYPFSEAYIKEFILFLRDCGGFSIR
tara:strand:- start:1929 stop:2429 length:501 start_codon:yes stop_codon:yes gene_type:complete